MLTILLQSQFAEWPLVISTIGLIIIIGGGVWKLGSEIHTKLDKKTFEIHVNNNSAAIEREHDYARGKISTAIFETEREQSRIIVADLKDDIKEAKRRNDEIIEMMGEMNTNIGVMNANIDWIRKNIKCD